jgi:hypothetical protein
VGLLLVAVLVPGRGPASAAALCVAGTIPFLPELGLGRWGTVGWVLLWLAVAWLASQPSPGTRVRARLGGLESGGVGLLLAPALLALLLAAVARLDLAPEPTRRASWGALVLTLGFLHLMLRRHAVRAATAFAALGLGAQALETVARGVAGGELPGPGLPFAAAVIAVSLAARIGWSRVAVAGSAWVSDAHDLHD